VQSTSIHPSGTQVSPFAGQYAYLIFFTSHLYQITFYGMVINLSKGVRCQQYEDYPKFPPTLPILGMYNGLVRPSPEHLASILEGKATMDSSFQRQAVAKQETPSGQRDKAGPEVLTEPRARMGSARISCLSWFILRVQCLLGGLDAGRGNKFGKTKSIASHKEAAQEVQAVQEAQAGAKSDPEDDGLDDDSLDSSDLGTLSDISELSIGNIHTIRDMKRARAEKKRTEALNNAREAISQLAKAEIDRDPVLDYRFHVPDADPEATALVWHAMGVGKRYPTSEGFPCSGRPWEVKITRPSAAALFFGPDFCHRDAILRHVDNFSGPAEIYAHFEGKLLHVGFTIPRDALVDLGDSTKASLAVSSTMRKFNALAAWAKNAESGGQESFADYVNYMVRHDLINNWDVL
jgi:hypothetical protein